MRRLRIESELASDDFVLSGGAEPPDYASHLLDVARIARGRRFISHAALDMAHPSQLEGRVLAVLDSARKRTSVSWRTRIVSAAVVLLLLVPFAAARPVLCAVSSMSSSVSSTMPSSHEKILTIAEKERQPFQPTTEDALAASPGQRLLLDLETGASVYIQGWDEPRVRAQTSRRRGDIAIGRGDEKHKIGSVRKRPGILPALKVAGSIPVGPLQNKSSRISFYEGSTETGLWIAGDGRGEDLMTLTARSFDAGASRGWSTARN